MDIKNRNEYLLKSGYRDHPVVSVRSVSGFVPADVDTAFLDMLFGKKPKGLKTWPKAGNSLHWLSCRNGINLHTDPNYSRYAYQLVVRNDGWQITGLDQDKTTIIRPGACYILDTHSPHQLVKTTDHHGRYFVAVGFDSDELFDLEYAANMLVSYHAKGQP